MGPHSSDSIRSRADSTTTYVDTFAHRRKSRISDLTFVDQLEDAPTTHLSSSQSLASSLNDLSLTLNDDDAVDQSDQPMILPGHKAFLTPHDHIGCPPYGRIINTENSDSDDDDDDDLGEDGDLAERIDRLMAATMEALESSNRLVLDTLASRAKLAQLNAVEAALGSQLDARESHLHRQIQAVTDMTEFVSQKSAELQKLTSPFQATRLSSGASSTTQRATVSDPAELAVRGAAATGIVQALDRDATIGKTAAKRLERMLQAPSSPSTTSPSAAASAQSRNGGASRRAFSTSNFATVQSGIAEEGLHEQEDTASTPDVGPSARQKSRTATSPASTVASSDSRTSTPQKKRSVSYDSRAPAGMKLMSKLAGPCAVASSGFVPNTSFLTAPPVVAGPAFTSLAASVSSLNSPTSTAESKAVASTSGSTRSDKPAVRPSLMATLRRDTASAHSDSAARSQPTGVPGLPSYSRSVSLKGPADVSATSTSAESTLAALLGMPSATSSSSRTQTPSESSYFDSAMEGSISSASPPTPGSIHAIHDVLATPWKPTTHNDMQDDSAVTSSQDERIAAERPCIKARRASIQSSQLVSPRASLSPSDRDRAQQLSSQLAQLRAERVTWNSHSIGSAEAGTAGTPTPGIGSGGGGALRALQKLNEMSAAKIAGHSGPTGEDEGSAWYNGSKRVSLGLGLPSFTALRSSASRAVSSTTPSPSPSGPVPVRPTDDETADAPTTASASKLTDSIVSQAQPAADGDADAADTSSSSLLAGGWRSWTSWSTASDAANGNSSASQKC